MVRRDRLALAGLAHRLASRADHIGSRAASTGCETAPTASAVRRRCTSGDERWRRKRRRMMKYAAGTATKDGCVQHLTGVGRCSAPSAATAPTPHDGAHRPICLSRTRSAHLAEEAAKAGALNSAVPLRGNVLVEMKHVFWVVLPFHLHEAIIVWPVRRGDGARLLVAQIVHVVPRGSEAAH